MEGIDLNELYMAAKNGDLQRTVENFLDKHLDAAEMSVNFLIKSDFYEMALYILQNHGTLLDEPKVKFSVLKTLAEKPKAFASGNDLGLLQRLIFQWIPVRNYDQSTIPQSHTEDIECPLLSQCVNDSISGFGKVVQKVHLLFWNTIKKIAPSINDIHNKKVKHMQALGICKRMTLNQEGGKLDDLVAKLVFKTPIFIATKLGIEEFVNEIIAVYPNLTFSLDEKNRNIFQLAVLHRQEKVFSLIYKMSDQDKYLLAIQKEKESKYNMLHLAEKSQPSSRISGAALQMQREWQWFQAVENLVPPYLQEERNVKYKDKDEDEDEDEGQDKTHREMFTENHKDLVKEAKKWMKNIAQSYTLVAALITTVVFTAIFTVPGGNDSEGVPIYLHELSFLIFSISDALALFLSSTSMLIFLGILTSRYLEEDFLKILPTMLIFGLATLFLSIVFMMAAFGAALHIVLVHRFAWVAIPIIIPACVTVIFFAVSQFPLLLEIWNSTYGPSNLKPE